MKKGEIKIYHIEDDGEEFTEVWFTDKETGEHWHNSHENCKVWWLESQGQFGQHIFTFDMEKRFNLFRDYPYKLTADQKKSLTKKTLIGQSFLPTDNMKRTDNCKKQA